MKQLRSPFLLVLVSILLCGSLAAQEKLSNPADVFFRKVLKAAPDSYFPLTDENSGNYEEKIAGGKFVTRQSFLLYDAYASGKARYAKPMVQPALEKYFPGTTFLQGELSCNMEFHGGKLPFLGYVNATDANYFVHPGYDLIGKTTLAFLGKPSLKNKGASENYADALMALFAELRLRPAACNAEIALQKSKFTWVGEVLTVRRSYTSECALNDQTGEWGAKEFVLEVDFEFAGGHLQNVSSITWP